MTPLRWIFFLILFFQTPLSHAVAEISGLERQILIEQISQTLGRDIPLPCIIAIRSPSCTGCLKNTQALINFSKNYWVIIIHIEEPKTYPDLEQNSRICNIFDPRAALARQLELKYLPVTYFLGVDSDEDFQIIGLLDRNTFESDRVPLSP